MKHCKISNKVISMVLCLLMLLSVVGCQNKPASSEPEKATAFKAGTYTSSTFGHNAPMSIEVIVDDNEIKSVSVTEEYETIGVGKKAIEMLSTKVVDEQSIGIDTISGATLSSMGFLKGVEDCLVQANADIDKLKVSVEKHETENVTYDTDVVVIGGGGAGLAAAVSAEQNGANVIVVEKLGILGGSTNVSEGALNAVDDKRQSAQGIEDSIEKFYTQTLEGGHNVGDPELVSYMTQNAYPAVEWLESLGVQFKDKIGAATGSLWQRSHYPTTPSGNSYIRVYTDYINNSDNIKLIINTKATELIKDETGRVTGVIAENNGREVRINVSKGVIVATGGFGANIELRQEVNKGVWADVALDSTIGCTNMNPSAQGDGIVMGEAIGAQVIGMSDIQIHPCGHPKTGLMVDIRTSGRNRIFVNREGARFVNEGTSRDALCKAIFEQEESTYWIVVNSVRYPSRDWVDANGATIANMVEQKNVIEADTLEELAEKIEMNADTLKASIEQYNQVVRGNVEKDIFGFEANNEADVELLEGPWYACRKVPTVHHTMGGLKINVNTEVLDVNDQVIEGLFACGEVTGGIHGSNRLGGNAIADCTVFGKLAGEKAAQNN